MSDLWRRVLDLEQIPADAAEVHLAWAREWPEWVWLVIVFSLGLYAVWSYSGLSGNRRVRGLLAVLRFTALFGLALLLAGPMLVMPQEHVEQDWLVALVDRSASMQVADVQREEQALTREAQLREILAESAPALSRLAEERQVLWMGFDATASELSAGPDGLPNLDEPQGRQTSLDAAVTAALQRLAGRPISGIVILSDGRTPNPPGGETLVRLREEGVGIYPVPLGSGEALANFAVERVDAPGRALVHDPVRVRVDIEASDDPDRLGGLSGEVRLVDERSGAVVDSARVEDLSREEGVTLFVQPEGAGERTYIAEVVPDSRDFFEADNRESFSIEFVDRPLRLLYVEGDPRWEFRFIRDLMLRETTLDTSFLQLTADQDFAQEGHTPLARLPNSPGEWEPFDVIMIGDVAAGSLSPRQREMIRDQVAENGAGILWIAGPRFTPVSYAQTELAGLMPLTGGLRLAQHVSPVWLKPTEAAEALGQFQIESVGGGGSAWSFLSDPAITWAAMVWALRIEPEQLKPTAEVLLETVDEEPLPIAVSMRYGAGMSMLMATDEIWRWRYGHGDALIGQFWVPLARSLARGRLELQEGPVTVSVSPRRVEPGEAAVIEVRVNDQRVLQEEIETVVVEVRERRSGATDEVELSAVEGDGSRFSGVTLLGEGEYEVRVAAPAAFLGGSTALVSSAVRDEEMQRAQADHDLLRDLAAQTGGRVLETPEARAGLPELLPNRSVVSPMDIEEPIWDSPLCLGLLVLLLTAEWVVRRVIRLV